jgi:hypothetical protein
MGWNQEEKITSNSIRFIKEKNKIVNSPNLIIIYDGGNSVLNLLSKQSLTLIFKDI